MGVIIFLLIVVDVILIKQIYNIKKHLNEVNNEIIIGDYDE